MRFIFDWAFRTSNTGYFFDRLVFVAFIVEQILDGVFTYFGVSIFGLNIEANPLIRWFMSVAGVALGLVATKLLGVVSVIILYRLGFCNLILLLVVFYAVIVVFPWVYIFLTL